MRKGLVLIVILTLLLQGAFAQILEPVKWSWAAEPMPMVKGKYKLIFKAKIDKGWHTYSQFIGEGGPVPTSITFDLKNNDIEYIGKTTERGGIVHEKREPLFENMLLKYFDDEMVCEQIVKIKKDMVVKGTIYFQTCTDRECIRPTEIPFEFNLKFAAKSEIEVKWDSAHNEKNVVSTTNEKFDSTVKSLIGEELVSDTQKAVIAAASTLEGKERFGNPVNDCVAETGNTENQSIWSIILLGFLGGLAALLTPCVFPMIPLTVSFFTKRSESKTKGKLEAMFYAFCIVFIYFLISVPFLISDISPSTLNDISTGAVLNVIFFVTFLIFAFSFLGFYEIQLPSFIANKADSASNFGGLIGIFFMALTLAIVSFSCTGPILGSLLVGALSSSGGKLNLVAGMTSFGFALALPFGLFAMFPNLMKSLPKSGGWLDSVKKVLGFVELVFAIKFLSNADLVSHWGVLKREVFLGVWALIGLACFLYLIGKLPLPHNSPVTKFSPIRILAAAFILAFTGYSIYGIPGNNLKLFSGFPPPMFYSIIEKKQEIKPIHNDYAAALAQAKAENKPLMIDYTGWACVNCRKMEETVWPDNDIKRVLTEEYVIVSLYVDDKEKLPANEQIMSDILKGKMVTIGDKNSDMQARYFNKNVQPYYVLVSPDEKLLTNPVPFTPDVNEYKKFLDCGLKAFKQVAKAE